MVERQCLNCRKPFQVPYPSSKRVNCSEPCRIERLRKADRKPRTDTGTRKSKWVSVECPECGKAFEVPPWRVRHAQKGAGRIFCSSECNAAHWSSGRMMGETKRPPGRPRTAEGSRQRSCRKCGTTFDLRYPSQNRVFCADCSQKRVRRGTARRLTDKGYIQVFVPPAQRPPDCGKQRDFMEHRIVMERAIGRFLTDEESVHHKNGKRDDNRLKNLELWSTRHPKGQRVTDQLAWAREILATYEPIEDSL